MTIFLAILSGGVITLALVAQADSFGRTFISIAIPLLTVVLFAGIATISRLNALNRDDYRWVIGMNRLRHAYLQMHPELEPHFITSHYDDLRGGLQTLGLDHMTDRPGLGSESSSRPSLAPSGRWPRSPSPFQRSARCWRVQPHSCSSWC
ncbi:MAG: hypothetical protein E6I52_11485 [Chloroflexi bacterium]|nr:MAG: hypothetical protein E6I52_11485 [Chloroflexota bacterium]